MESSSSPSINAKPILSASSPSPILDSSHNPVAENPPEEYNTSSEASPPLTEIDIPPNSDHESDFDFSESFEAPTGSPMINLN